MHSSEKYLIYITKLQDYPFNNYNAVQLFGATNI